MKQNVDIHVALATFADMEDYHDDPDGAAEQLNLILHLMYDRADEDIDTQRLEKLLGLVWETWHQDLHLVDLDEGELLDWVDHQLATWDDADTEETH